MVSTDVSGAKEMLGDANEYGLVVENSTDGIYEGLKKMLSNQQLFTHYKEQADIRGKYFSKENAVKSVQDLVEQL